MTGFLRRHPLASVGIAFGIGALLAARGSARRAALELDRPEQPDRPMH
jgi:hypothetical protein